MPVKYVEPDLSEYDRLLQQLLGTEASIWLKSHLPTWLRSQAFSPELQAVQHDAAQLQQWMKPKSSFSTVAHCMCKVAL